MTTEKVTSDRTTSGSVLVFPRSAAHAGTVIFRRALRAGLPLEVARTMQRIASRQVMAGHSAAAVTARKGQTPRPPAPGGAA